MRLLLPFNRQLALQPSTGGGGLRRVRLGNVLRVREAFPIGNLPVSNGEDVDDRRVDLLAGIANRSPVPPHRDYGVPIGEEPVCHYRAARRGVSDRLEETEDFSLPFACARIRNSRRTVIGPARVVRDIVQNGWDVPGRKSGVGLFN